MKCIGALQKIFVYLLSSAWFTACAQDTASLDASIRKGVTAYREGRYQEARLTLEGVLRTANLPRDDRRWAIATEVLASADQKLGDIATATTLHLEVLSATDENSDTGKAVIVLDANNLSGIRVEQGRWDEADRLLQKALTLNRQAHGERSPRVAVGLNNLGALYMLREKWREAVPLFEEAVPVLRKAAPQFGTDLAAGLGNLGSTYAQLGRWSQAMPLLEEAVALGTQTVGDGLVLGDALVALAWLHRGQGNTDRAEPLLRKAMAIYEKAGGRPGPHRRGGRGSGFGTGLPGSGEVSGMRGLTAA